MEALGVFEFDEGRSRGRTLAAENLGGVAANDEAIGAKGGALHVPADGLAGAGHDDFIISVGGDGKLESGIASLTAVVVPGQVKAAEQIPKGLIGILRLLVYDFLQPFIKQ